MLGLIIAAIAVVVIVLVVFSYYNRFAVLQNRIENSFAQIDVQLRKRSDLVPNLIEAVKGYMKHERGIMTEVTKARKVLMGAMPSEDIAKKVKAGDMLQNALKSLFAIAENYPNLKANENFLHLQNELSAIEDKVAYARQFYNDSILSYNNLFRTIPGKWFAGLFRKQAQKYLEIPAASRAVPKVKF
jgi:LemA protein